MRRAIVLVSFLATVAVPGTALADHPSGGSPFSTSNSTTGFNAGGEGAEWEIVRSFFSANPFTDLDVFTQDGDLYASVGTLAAGLNGGQTIIRLTVDGEVAPEFVSAHPSASCITDPSQALGLQHDAEATPKGDVLFNTDWGGKAVRRDAQLVIDATDNPGRCHDQGPLLGLPGTPRPQGGLEIIDVTDIENPVEIGLTSHIGEAHTVNVDPSRPHIAYAVSSDSVGVQQDTEDWDGDGDTEELIRRNEEPESGAMDLDGFEVVDLSSCMGFPADATVEAKRGIDPESGEILDGQGCRPEVYRFRFALGWTQGTFNWDSQTGCHELELHPNDLLTCGAPDGTLILDVSGAFDANGKPRGTPLPCRVRESTSTVTSTDAPVTDCVVGEGEADLSVPGWLAAGAPSLEGVRLVGFVNHGGRAGGATANNAGHSPTEDIAVAHEAELTHSGRFVFSSDERGGGVVPPDASCPVPGQQPAQGNGGLHAFPVDQLLTRYPGDPLAEEASVIAERAREAYALDPEGEKAIYRATPRVPAEAVCTAHVFQQIPGQNRIFMGWYSQGTQVVDYIEHPDGTFEWKEAGWFIPEGANTWTSHVFKVDDNGDGTFTYWGLTGDFNLGAHGRNAIDVYKVTMPAPPQLAEAPEPPAPTGPDPAPPPSDDLPTTGSADWQVALGTALLGAAALGAGLLRRRHLAVRLLRA